MTTSMNKQFNNMSFQAITNKSASQLEIDNAYLLQQNQHLAKELSFTRYTINALKNMTTQKDNALNETRQELERALQHIQLLTCTLTQQQRYSLSGIGPQLMQDDLSDDQELSEEDELYEETRPNLDIMSKLPLRHPANQIFIKEY
ncbi:hypothetical protein BDF21DRAFT_419667 [Thamnidium elegans]|uniref:Uncharacterized protein n=1 Tax=Thamnidium elegans TaxID=101142 RepID=A0A8H7W1I8_9FUNG|nr:hypothetical protein INT48_000813 [Thamnidium elegans]KAI8079209.1 hypothetical protein BDF21DRAFT_419667 [Thamnidium elegans]